MGYDVYSRDHQTSITVTITVTITASVYKRYNDLNARICAQGCCIMLHYTAQIKTYPDRDHCGLGHCGLCADIQNRYPSNIYPTT
jgi:hypothetical protein